jgi:chromosome segregation ATPase
MLQSLLSEVRELRLALQRSNLTTFRTQVALERLRLQMGRVESLRESLERTREELANERSTRLGMADQLKELEDRISAEKGAAKRESLITEQTELKTALNQASFREEQQREKENRLSSELQVEQTKLDEMSNKLETMERKLEAQWPEEGPRQNRRQ